MTQTLADRPWMAPTGDRWNPEPGHTPGHKKARWLTFIVLAVFGALVVATVVAVHHDVSTPSSGGVRIMADDGLGIGYGINAAADWGCGVVSQGTFACVGTTPGGVYIGSGSRDTFDVGVHLASSTGNIVAVRFDPNRWRCDTGVTVASDRRGFTCTQRY